MFSKEASYRNDGNGRKAMAAIRQVLRGLASYALKTGPKTGKALSASKSLLSFSHVFGMGLRLSGNATDRRPRRNYPNEQNTRFTHCYPARNLNLQWIVRAAADGITLKEFVAPTFIPQNWRSQVRASLKNGSRCTGL